MARGPLSALQPKFLTTCGGSASIGMRGLTSVARTRLMCSLHVANTTSGRLQRYAKRNCSIGATAHAPRSHALRARLTKAKPLTLACAAIAIRAER